MTAQSKTVIKSYFQTGDKPTQAQFEDLIDSYQDASSLQYTSYQIDVGTANNYVINPSTPLTSYTEGISYAVKILNQNTSSSTLNVSSLGAKQITYIDGTALSSGALPASAVVLLYYNGTQFVLTNIIPSTGGASGITALTGDVVASGTGSVIATIQSGSVDNSKLANMSANSVKARSSTTSGSPSDVALSTSQLLGRGSTGDVAAITIGSGLSMSGTTLAVTSSSNVNTITRQVFTSSGTYTPSSGLLYAEIEIVGGGGGGGGVAATSSNCAGGGGGAGGYAKKEVSAATIGASQTVTIGASGTAGSSSGGTGGSGGTTSVGALVSATGGSGGVGSSGTSASGGNGGSGSSGDVNMNGSDGGTSNVNSASTSMTISGYGGSSVFSGSRRGLILSTGNSNGLSGQSSSGAGGSGAVGNSSGSGQSGGAGGSGIVIITEYRSV